MKKEVLFDNAETQWIVFGRDPKKPEAIIDTNEYLIKINDEAILLDPGGLEIFPNVLSTVSETIDIDCISAYLCSHQDPDIMSSLPLWMELTPDAKIYLSWLWGGFVSHFGYEYAKNFVDVPDEGMSIEIGGKELKLIPAHHLHSAGNFHLYDPSSKLYFSGDIGAALVPDESELFVEDFESHIPFMEKFHQRWMPSNTAKSIWINRVKKLDIEMLCPQHGCIFKGKDVENFLHWFEELEVGKLK